MVDTREQYAYRFASQQVITVKRRCRGLAAMLDYARPATPWWSPRSTGSAAPSPKSPGRLLDLGERRITLRALREGVDTATPTGRAVAAIMATLAELELELGRERRAASRESRRARQPAGHQAAEAQSG